MPTDDSTAKQLWDAKVEAERLRREAEEAATPGYAEPAGHEIEGVNPYTKYYGETKAAWEAENAIRQEAFEQAGATGTARAEQLRGDALRAELGGVYAGGSGLAARQAMMGAIEGSGGAGREGARMGSADRLTASATAMESQGKGAAYESAAYQRFLDLREAGRERDRLATGTADVAGETDAERERKRRELIGALAGAAGAAAGA